MQRSGAAKVHILIKDLYKFKNFAELKFICKFSARGSDVKSSNNLLEKLQDSGSAESGRRRGVRSDASLIFAEHSTNIRNEM